MNTSSTIKNLEQAINCAGKCDCCDKLFSKISALEKRISKLEKTQKPEDTSLQGILKRLSNIEFYINDLEKNLKFFSDSYEKINKEISNFFDLFIGIFNNHDKK